jgi:hypothetical protein
VRVWRGSEWNVTSQEKQQPLASDDAGGLDTHSSRIAWFKHSSMQKYQADLLQGEVKYRLGLFAKTKLTYMLRWPISGR